MSLKKWFHVKFSFQNLKKSKALLAILLFLFPLILSLTQISSAEYGAVDLLKNNILVILGMAIIPVLLSLILFSFVYKKKKVDFIVGMPLSRKQIFASNTVSGILIIIGIFVMNILFLGLFTLFNSSVTLSIPMIIDYVLTYGLGYILVFTVTNVAMSLAGNFITQIVLTLLLLFLVPFCLIFHQSFTQSSSRLVELECSNQQCQEIIYDQCEDFTGIQNCKQQAANGYYYTVLDQNFVPHYSVPVGVVLSPIFGTSSILYQASTWLRTFLFSIFFIVIGFITFQKRKMEQCETSFTSFKVHSFVKCLTLIPFGLLLAVANANLRDSAIVILVLLAYFYLYDLITKKGIQHIGRSFIYFVVTLVICFGYYYGMEAYLDSLSPSNMDYIKDELKISDIASFSLHSLNSSELGMIEGYPTDEIEFKGTKQIRSLLQYAFQAQETPGDAYYIAFKLTLKDQRNYSGFLTLTNSQYQEFITTMKAAEEVKNIKQAISHDILTVSFLEKNYTKQQIETIMPNLEKMLSTSFSAPAISNTEMATVTIYDHHQLLSLSFPVLQDQTIANTLMEKNNEKVKTILKKTDVHNIMLLSNGAFLDTNQQIQQVITALQDQPTAVDSSKEYLVIAVYTNKGTQYYVSNQMDLANYFSTVEQE